MSGHSKWSTIKRKKGALDAKARQDFHETHQGNHHRGPGSAEETPTATPACARRFRTAKGANMPQDNITRAIAKGTGDLEGRELRGMRL